MSRQRKKRIVEEEGLAGHKLESINKNGKGSE